MHSTVLSSLTTTRLIMIPMTNSVDASSMATALSLCVSVHISLRSCNDVLLLSLGAGWRPNLQFVEWTATNPSVHLLAGR